MEMDFEPNSHKYKMDQIAKEGQTVEEKKVEKVVSGNVTKKKRSFLKRFADIFITEDVGDVKTYLIYDVLIPAIKENVAEMINSTINMMFFGETYRRPGKKPAGSGSRFDYAAASNPRREKLPSYNRSKIAHNFDDVVFETRGDAEFVLEGMMEILNSDYRQVTVADFYDLAGISTAFTDNKYGWTDLRGSRIIGSPARGYTIALPKCMILE